MGWKAGCRGPLVISLIRTAKHGDLTIAIRLCCNPLHYVVPVLGLLNVCSKPAPGVAPTARVDDEKWKALGREIGRTRMVAIHCVGRQREEAWRRVSQVLR